MERKDYTVDREKILDRNERSKLLRVCKEKAELDLLHGRKVWPVRYMLVDLALYTGLRVAEIAALRVGDLNLAAKDPYLVVRNGKGSKKRDVYMDKALAKHLREFITYKKKVSREDVSEDAPFFSGRNGRQPPPVTLRKSFKRALAEAGLPDHYSIHCARHTYATYLLHDTGNMRYVQKQLGHARIDTTAVYADILPEENGVLANKIIRDE